jgi:hypothetical protein
VDERTVIDLAKLASERCERALRDVTQLIDSEQQVYAVVMATAMRLIEISAQILQDGMEKQNGTKPPLKAATAHVIAEIVDGLELHGKTKERE